MTTIQTLYCDNDTILEVEALKNELTGGFLNSATVTVTLEDSNGDAVAGDTWPKTMAYVTGSDGVYRATLPYTLSITDGGRYTALITADSGAGLHAEWSVECVGRNR